MKKYNLIYADFPWIQKAGRPLRGYKIENKKQLFIPTSNVSKNLPYKTMTIEEGTNLDVKEISEKDAFLFFFFFIKHLFSAKEIIESWGFRYVACITWKKKKMGGGLGGVVRITSEFLMFCRRGNLKALENIPESVIEAKRPYVKGFPCHSKKPEVFRELIERITPPGNKLEMFARHHTEGWDVYGDEVDNSIKINNSK